jgi:hypothetical protein
MPPKISKIGKARIDQLRQFSIAVKEDPAAWEDPALREKLSREIKTPSDYAELLTAVYGVVPDLFRDVLQATFRVTEGSNRLQQAAHVWMHEIMLLFYTKEGLDEELEDHLAKFITDEFEAKSDGKKEIIDNFFAKVLPGYMLGATPEAMVEEEAVSELNSSRLQRLDLLKDWLLSVGTSSLADTEENHSSLNTLRTFAVENPENYVFWFNTLKSLSKDLLKKTAAYYKFGTPEFDLNSAVEILRKLLIPLNANWVNDLKKQEFTALAHQLHELSQKGTGNAGTTIKNFATKNVSQILAPEKIQIETDDQEVPTFNVFAEGLEEFMGIPPPSPGPQPSKKRRNEDEEPEPKKTKKKIEIEEQKPVTDEPMPDPEPRKKTKPRKKKVTFDEQPKVFEFTPPEAPTPGSDRGAEADLPNWSEINKKKTKEAAPKKAPKKSPKKSPKADKKEAPKKTPKKVPKEKVPKRPAKTTPKEKPSKKQKTELEELQITDHLQMWPSIELNADKTEPKVGLVEAIKKAKKDTDFEIIKSWDHKLGTRFFGRRLSLRTSSYSKKASEITEKDILSSGQYGVWEVAESYPVIDTRNLRKLSFVDDKRFLFITPIVESAKSGKTQAWLTRQGIRPGGAYISADAIGRPLDKNGRPILVRVIKSGDSMIVRGAVAYIKRKKIVSQVQNLKLLFTDSGGQISEISYETANKLGLFDPSVPKKDGPTIRTSNGEYRTQICTLTIQIEPEAVRKFDPRFQDFEPEEVVHTFDFAFPTEPNINEKMWDILVGLDDSCKMGLVLQFVDK